MVAEPSCIASIMMNCDAPLICVMSIEASPVAVTPFNATKQQSKNNSSVGTAANAGLFLSNINRHMPLTKDTPIIQLITSVL